MRNCRPFATSLLLCVSLVNLHADEVRAPSTPAGEHLAEFLKLCDAPDEAAFTRYNSERRAEQVLKRRPAAAVAHGNTVFCTQTGGMRLQSAEVAENSVIALVQARATDDWMRLQIDVEPAAAHKIVGFRFESAEPPETLVPHGMADTAIRAEMQRYMKRLVSRDRFWGVVLLAKDGRPVFQGAYGMADVASRRRNSMATIFTLASIAKMFTATAMGQLIEEGKVSLADPVGKFLPGYPNRQVREEVTIAELLTHTSGLGDFVERRTAEMQSKGVKRAEDYLPLFQNDKLGFAPGKGWGYSNAGYALLGAVIERVSGQSYFDYVREHVFKPAGMTSCDPNESLQRPPRLVTPYEQKSGGKPGEVEPAERDIGSPAGGSYCTAGDLVRFSQALQHGTLISQAVFQQLVTPHSKTDWGTDYGYGFELAQAGGRREAGHGGGFPGVSTRLEMYLDQGYVLVVLSNYGVPAEIIERKVRPMITRK